MTSFLSGMRRSKLRLGPLALHIRGEIGYHDFLV